ncbi:endoribonuclease ysh1 [Coemansia spiralis]|uniref:Endoribonuclease ysh1 n=1 Tax=Coemansia spiralis TaxID=417178 RepID=A0A9W8L7A7_9FUNG|nr:endoribonuclease ysh1 [Coemansia spiralis]
MTTKRKAEVSVPIEDENDQLTITPLGAGREVGRSCIVLEYKGKKIMLDCGLHAGRNGPNSLPYFDEVDPATIDVLLVTHFHIDHAAAVPYYLEHTSFKGRTFMTRPTKGVFRWLATDYIRVTNTSNSDTSALYSEADLISAHAKIEEIDVHQQVEVNGIKFTAYNAGHVLGAAMFLIEIAGVKVLYTGDYSREEDRHLVQAENPGVSIHVLITESTYGVQSHHPRAEREREFMTCVRDVVRRRGCCLMPVTALGRTQELLLILEEHWGRYAQELEGVPVFFISALGKAGTRLYQAYIMHMNQRIQRQFNRTGRNPFDFKYIKTSTNIGEVPDSGPCVVLASPGMLQNGVSRQLLERWAPRPENGLIVTGYSVEGTLARTIVNSPDVIPAFAGGTIPRRMTVKNISFSAHVDYAQNSAFIDEIRAPHVILVHGEENAMKQLRAKIIDTYRGSDYEVAVYAPANTHKVRLQFHGEKVARVMGSLASKVPREGDYASGILVERDFSYTLVDVADLHEFTSIAPVVIEQQLCVPYASSYTLLRYHLEQMFGELVLTTERSDSGVAHVLRIYDVVDVCHSSWKSHVEIEWEGNAMNDMVADSVVAIVLNIESSPASVKLTQSSCSHDHGTKPDISEADDASMDASEAASQDLDSCGDTLQTRVGDCEKVIAKLALFMQQQFTEVAIADDGLSLVVTLNGLVATIDAHSLDVATESPMLRARIAPIIARVRRTMRPLGHHSLPLPEPVPASPLLEKLEELQLEPAAKPTNVDDEKDMHIDVASDIEDDDDDDDEDDEDDEAYDDVDDEVDSDTKSDPGAEPDSIK